MNILKSLITLFIVTALFCACMQPNTLNPTDMTTDTTENLFNEGDVLSFQYPDQTYGITILLKITRSGDTPDFPIPDVHDYDFCRTTFRSANPPQLTDLNEAKLIGYNMKLGFWGRKTKTMFYTYFMSHERLKECAGNFCKIGALSSQNLHDRVGATTGAPDFNAFCEGFDQYEVYNNQWNEYTVKEFPLNNFIE